MKILHTDYINLCDFKFLTNGPLPPNNSIVHCHLDEIVEFFDLVSETNNNYVLVSSNSDYCLSYQNEQNTELKMKRWLKFIDTKDLRYNSMVIPARCDIEQCRITDKYAINMYSWIKSTFNRIPPNIKKWFCTNVDIDDDIVTPIPFGCPLWSTDLLSCNKKEKTLYVNFMQNTIERANLLSYYKSMSHNDLVCEKDVSHERYCDMLSKSKFVLASAGNGFDQYRILEAIYSKTIPIIEKARWIKAYDYLPVLALDNLYVSIDELNEVYDNLYNQVNWTTINSRADLYYWRNQIFLAKETLLS